MYAYSRPSHMCAHVLLWLLQDNPTLYALWPDGTCARLGLEGTANTSLSTMLHAMVDASNTPALASVLNARLDNITQSFAGNGSTASAASQVNSEQGILLGLPVLQVAIIMALKSS